MGRFTICKTFYVQLSGEYIGFNTGKWSPFLHNIPTSTMCQYGRWVSKGRHSLLDLPRSLTWVASHCGVSSHISWTKPGDGHADDLQDLCLGWHCLILWSWRQLVFLLHFYLDRTVLKSFHGWEVIYILRHCTLYFACLPNCIFR